MAAVQIEGFVELNSMGKKFLLPPATSSLHIRQPLKK
jgi:hypothetical protein|tara:strand:+ start:209 stop:319 length:111 start_codon:yes stop_codon:yes gene_type:complete